MTGSAPTDERRRILPRWLFATLGCILVGIGAIGVIVPLLPTTPFMLLAAACFARGSRRLYAWLLRTRLFGPTIRAWQETRSIPLAAKITAIALMVVVMSATVLLVPLPGAAQIGLPVIGLGVIGWLLWLPTRGKTPALSAAPSGVSAPPTRMTTMKQLLLMPLGVGVALTGVASADFSHVEVRDISAEVGTPPGLRTWRLFAIFVPPFEQILAVAGTDEVPLVFETNDPDGLFNDGGMFSGHKAEDFAQFPISAAYDSWVSIGATGFAGNCTDYSPTFLDNNGTDAVIFGTSWSDTNDGWFDSHPGGTSEEGPEVVLAQFTVRDGYGIRLAGNINFFVLGGEGSWPFCAISPNFTSICACPPDLDDDLQVGLGDLLMVLSNWGPCPSFCCRADLDGSADVDFQDLLMMLSQWGPCPLLGACCFADGTCATARCLDGAECTRAGGIYLGSDTSCDDALCPPPAACCMPDGTCAARFEAGCLAGGGLPQGDDTSCADVVCAQPGACCLDDGACNPAAEVGGPICAMAGGIYQGDDTLCADIRCDHPGACCFEGGTCALAARFGGADCIAAGGLYQGDGTVCSSVCMGPGICCLPEPACEIMMEDDCLAAGGNFIGPGPICNVDCTRGACCLPDGECFFVAPEVCAALAGVYQGDGVGCELAQCP